MICLLCGRVNSDSVDSLTDCEKESTLSKEITLKQRLLTILFTDEEDIVSSLSKLVHNPQVNICGESCKENTLAFFETFQSFLKLRGKCVTLSSSLCRSIVLASTKSTSSQFNPRKDEEKTYIPSTAMDNFEEWNQIRVKKMLTAENTNVVSFDQNLMLESIKRKDSNNDERCNDLESFEDDTDAIYSNDRIIETEITPTPNDKITLSEKTRNGACNKILIDEQTCNSVDLKKSAKTNRYKCSDCPKSFATSVALGGHRRIHFKQIKAGGTYRCGHCNIRFNTSIELTNHNKIHEDERNYCTVCERKLSKGILKDHLYSHYEKDVAAVESRCNICSKLFDSPLMLAIHMDVHKGRFSCQESSCKKSFVSTNSLDIHKKVHKEDSGLFGCDFCFDLIDSETELQNHILNHNSKALFKQFLCDSCGSYFMTKLALRRHKREHHTEEIRYSCEICLKEFAAKRSLVEHSKTHLEIRTFTFSCPECKISFNKKLLFDRHMRKHEGTFQYNCSFCENTGFSYAKGLRHHIFESHPEKFLKKFMCFVCYKNFHDESTLQAHAFSHERLKCKICNRQFQALTHLKEHLLRHAELRPYKCHVKDCPSKGFVRESQLTAHLKKAHPNICSSSFSSIPIESVTYVIEMI